MASSGKWIDGWRDDKLKVLIRGKFQDKQSLFNSALMSLETIEPGRSGTVTLTFKLRSNIILHDDPNKDQTSRDADGNIHVRRYALSEELRGILVRAGYLVLPF